jgi:Protein of unknown function (DUF2934)
MTTSKRTSHPSGGKPRQRRTKSPSAAALPQDRHASIAEAAYFRSQNRGFLPGHELEDWLAAEEEIDQRLRGEGRVS